MKKNILLSLFLVFFVSISFLIVYSASGSNEDSSTTDDSNNTQAQVDNTQETSTITPDEITRTQVEDFKEKKTTLIEKKLPHQRVINLMTYRSNLNHAIKSKEKSEIQPFQSKDKKLKGLLIKKVVSSTIVAELFLERGDILLSYDNEPFQTLQHYEHFKEKLMQSAQTPGSEMEILIWRKNERILLKVKLH